MINIQDFVIPLAHLEQMTFLEAGKSIKEAFLDYYKYNEGIVNFLKYNIDDSRRFKVLVKDFDELTRVLTFFDSVHLVGAQDIKLRIYNVSVEEIYDAFMLYEDSSFLNKIYLPLDKNNEFISWKKFKEFTLKLKAIKKCIPESSSQLEIVTYIYDYVKSKKYIEVPDNPHSMEARKLSNSFLDGYRVCVGFSKEFNMLLREFNIPCTEYRFMYIENGEKKGHDISLVNINDTKYNIHGLYFFDPTADSYLEKDGENNKTKYEYFLKTFDSYKDIMIIEDSFNGYLQKDEKILSNMIPGMMKSAEQYHSNIFDNDNFSNLVSDAADLIGLDDDLFPDSNHSLCNTDDAMLEKVNIHKYILEFKKQFGEDIEPKVFSKLLHETHNDSDNFFLKSMWSKFKNNNDIYNIISNEKRRI